MTDRKWNPEMRSKVSVRLLLLWATVTLVPVIVKHDWRGFIGGVVLVQSSLLVAEGLASLWPTVFGRQDTGRRVKAAWASLNRTGRSDR